MPDQITTTRLARMQGITAETIRNRAKAVEKHLSEGASSRNGSKIVFNARDVNIMRRMHDLCDGARSYEEIEVIIADEVEQGLFDDVFDIPVSLEQTAARSWVEYEQRIGQYARALGEANTTIDSLRRKLATSEEELQEARHRIGMLEGELAAVQRLSEREDLRQKEKDEFGRTREEEINRLNREIGKLEARIEMLNEQLKE